VSWGIRYRVRLAASRPVNLMKADSQRSGLSRGQRRQTADTAGTRQGPPVCWGCRMCGSLNTRAQQGRDPRWAQGLHRQQGVFKVPRFRCGPPQCTGVPNGRTLVGSEAGSTRQRHNSPPAVSHHGGPSRSATPGALGRAGRAPACRPVGERTRHGCSGKAPGRIRPSASASLEGQQAA